MSSITLFGQRGAGVYLLTEIYNPDIDGDINTTSGKYVPAVGSLIVDNTTGLHNTLYTVQSVHPTTLKSTLVPSRIVTNGSNEVDRIYSYGNDVYFAYFNKVTIVNGSGHTVSLTRIHIDGKLAFIGFNTAEYELVKTATDGTKTIISVHYDTENNPVGNRGVIAETNVPGVRRCVPCYTYADLTEGDSLKLNVYDAAGILVAEIILIAKQATVLGELDDLSNPIVRFDATASQQYDAEFYLFVNQRVSDLAIYPTLHYADDSMEIVTIDNMCGFVYGLDDVSTKYAGQTFDIVIKYYLGEDTPCEIMEGEGDLRFVSCQKTIRIVYNFSYKISKISAIPVWKAAIGEIPAHWELVFYVYKANRDEVTILNSDAYTLEGFDGALFETRQEITITTTQINGSTTETVTQTIFFEGRNRATEYTGFLIADTEDAAPNEIYGSNTLPQARPVIELNANTSTFAISTLVFNTVEKFLTNFYYSACPPYLEESETIPPEPTHFTIRAPYTGQILLAVPKAITDYATAINLIYSGLATQYTDTTVVMEFLRETDVPGIYDQLYGVPVDIKQI